MWNGMNATERELREEGKEEAVFLWAAVGATPQLFIAV